MTFEKGDIVRSPSFPGDSDGIVLTDLGGELYQVLWLTYQGGDSPAIIPEAGSDLELVKRPEHR